MISIAMMRHITTYRSHLARTLAVSTHCIRDIAWFSLSCNARPYTHFMSESDAPTVFLVRVIGMAGGQIVLITGPFGAVMDR